MTFSSNFKEKGSFTRDYNQIKAELQNIEDFDKTCIENALHGVNQLILNEWGNNMACQIILVTDGSPGVGSGSLKESLLHSHKNITNGTFPLPFPFPAKLHVVCISQPNDPQFLRAKPLYQRLIDMGGYGGSVQIVDNQLNEQSVLTMFKKLAEDLFVTYNGTLKCGHLESKIYLSPAPIPFTKQSDFNKQTYTMADMLEVCGFVSVADIGSPMAISRHLILPIGQQHQLHHSKENQLPQQSSTSVNMETDAEEDPTTSTTPVTATTSPPSMAVTAAALTAAIAEDGKTPSFCVLLHGALKVENMAALVQLDTDWFGFVYSWADTKKKSNLMLTVLKPGTDSVPWLGDFHNLHCAEDFPVDTVVNFPLRPAEKRSYSQNSVVWIRQAGLQSDIQKILRHARKLPEKTQHFYKELNRLRKAAVQMGFLDLLISLSYIFEQECTQLPGSAHPDCALQLTHAADVLRKTQNKDLKHVITPLPTNYTA